MYIYIVIEMPPIGFPLTHHPDYRLPEFFVFQVPCDPRYPRQDLGKTVGCFIDDARPPNCGARSWEFGIATVGRIFEACDMTYWIQYWIQELTLVENPQ